jgi:hypothetical protein
VLLTLLDGAAVHRDDALAWWRSARAGPEETRPSPKPAANGVASAERNSTPRAPASWTRALARAILSGGSQRAGQPTSAGARRI